MKTIAISFGIGAVLGSSFIATTSTANKSLVELNNSIRKMEKDSKKVESLKSLRKEIINVNREISERKQNIEKLKKSLKGEGVDTEAVTKKIKGLGLEISELKKQYDKKKNIYDETKKSIKDEGIEVKDLSKAYENLKNKIKETEVKKKWVQGRENLKEFNKSLSTRSGQAIKVGASATALIFPAIKKAIESESAFADVKKQFDFKDDTEAKEYRKNLEKLITEKNIAIDLNELYSSAAIAGQSGIDKDESLEYIELATKMGVAFDISREEASKTMFEWKNAFNKPLPELKKLIDQVNYLGNTTGANSPAISEFINRVGNIGSGAGFDTGQIAAIGATLIEQGMAPEIAATGAKKLMGAMTKGFAATSGQKEVYEMLGLDSKRLAKDAQKDAEGTMIKILSRIKKMPKDKQGAILTRLFGEEGMRGAAGLLNNMERLQRNFGIVKNEKNYLGSYEKEFETRQNTAENAILVLKQMAAINIRNFGDLLLPTIAEGVKKLTEFSKLLIEFQGKHPKAFEFIAKALLGVAAGFTAVGIIGKGVSGIISGFTFLTSPVGLVVTAIIALVAAGYAIYKNWEQIKAKGIELKDAVIELVDKYWFLMGPLGYIVKSGRMIYQNWDLIKNKAGELKEGIVELVLEGIENWKNFKDKTIEILGIPFEWMEKKWENIKLKGKETVDYFLEIFEEIKNFSITDSISNGFSWVKDKVKENIPGFANGGIVNSPTLAMVGEGRTSETIIPHEKTANSLNLWEKTGRLLGVYEKSNTNNESYNNDFNFTYAPVINAADSSGVAEVLAKDKVNSYNQFKDWMDRYQRERFRKGDGR